MLQDMFDLLGSRNLSRIRFHFHCSHMSPGVVIELWSCSSSLLRFNACRPHARTCKPTMEVSSGYLGKHLLPELVSRLQQISR